MAPPIIYESAYTASSVPVNTSIWQFLSRHNVDDTPHDKVVLQEDERRGQKLTYGSARKVAAQVAAALQQKLGLRAGDIICAVAGSSMDLVRLAHGSWWAGITIALVNPLASAHELVHYIGTVEPKVVFCDAEVVMARVEQALGKLPRQVAQEIRIASLRESEKAPLIFSTELGAAGLPVELPFDMYESDNRKVVSTICFSSGTSGKPKAVQLSHHNLLSCILNCRSTDPQGYSGDQREVFFAPLAHIYGVVAALLVPVYTGAYILMMRNYDFHRYVRLAAEIRATQLRVVPPVADAMTKDPYVAQLDLKSVSTIACAGAVLATSVIASLESMMNGCHIVQGYGLTEGAVSTLRRSSAKRKAGSVGKLMAGVSLRVVDDDLKDIPRGGMGEFLVSSGAVFCGYKNNSEATAECFPFNDGWMRTGDVGYVDDEGYVWLTDRKKDLIKYKGNQIAPAELEDILLSHPMVTEAGVCAIWSENESTEVPIGYVNLKAEVPNRDQVLGEVLLFLNGQVSPYKKLRGGLFYLAGLPRNSTGKLLRRQLPARREQDERKALAARPTPKL